MNNNIEMKSVGEMCGEIKSLRAANAKLKEEQSYTEQLVAGAMRYAISQLPGAEEILMIKAENEKLKAKLIVAHKNADATDHAQNAGILIEENDRLQEGNKLASGIIKRLKINEKVREEKLQEVTLENKELGEEAVENKDQYDATFSQLMKLKQKATAWDIVNNGTDWQDLRDLCDQQMCEALIKTGECDEEDFEGYDYGQLS